MAIDERRRAFAPTLWDNLDALNNAVDGASCRQQGFPGVHGSAGGGGAVTALSDDAALGRLASGRDPRGPLRASKRDLISAVLRQDRVDRSGPAGLAELAPAAIARWRGDAGYRAGAPSRTAALLGR